MWLLRVRAESRMAPCSSSPIKWNGTRSSSTRFSQVTSGRRTRPDGRGARPRIWASYRIDGPEGEQTTMIAEAMGGGQSEDEVAHLSGAERDSPQPSPRGHVVIFLPALNEERAIGKVLDRIPRAQLEAAGYTVSIWLVDGNSTDRTLEVGRKNGASVFIQAGRGKGNGRRHDASQRDREPHPQRAGSPPLRRLRDGRLHGDVGIQGRRASSDSTRGERLRSGGRPLRLGLPFAGADYGIADRLRRADRACE